MAIIRVKTGAISAGDGTYPELRGTRKASLTKQDTGGKYEEATYRANVYSVTTVGGGVQLATTQLYSTTTATFTPILAIYNLLTNNKAFSILQAWCSCTQTPLTTGAQTGGFFWVSLTGASITNTNTATPFNMYTLKASGSSAIGIANAALLGVLPTTTVPTLVRPVSGMLQLTPAAASATAGLTGNLPIEDVGGSLIVPPGALLGFANGISNAVSSQFVSAGIVYEEIPL
jgi:hypothetical protein